MVGFRLSQLDGSLVCMGGLADNGGIGNTARLQLAKQRLGQMLGQEMSRPPEVWASARISRSTGSILSAPMSLWEQ